MKKRLVSLLLCLAALAGLVVLPVSAEGVQGPIRATYAAGKTWSYVFWGPDGVLRSDRNYPLLTDVAEARGDSYGGLALRKDGTLWSWGVDMDAEAGPIYKYTYHITRPDLPELLMEDVIDFDRVGTYDLVVKADHTLWVRGDSNNFEWTKLMDGVVQARLGCDATTFIQPSLMILGVLDKDGVLWNLELHSDWTTKKYRLDSGVDRLAAFSDDRDFMNTQVHARTYAWKGDGSLWGYLYDEGNSQGSYIDSPSDHYYSMGFPLSGDGPLWSGKLMDGVERVYLHGENGAALTAGGALYVWGDASNLPGVEGESIPTTEYYQFQKTPLLFTEGVTDLLWADYQPLTTVSRDGILQNWCGGIDQNELQETPLVTHTITYLPGTVSYDLGDEGRVSLGFQEDGLTLSGVLHDPNIQSVALALSESPNDLEQDHTLPQFTPGVPFSYTIPRVQVPDLEWERLGSYDSVSAYASCYGPYCWLSVSYGEDEILPSRTLVAFHIEADPAAHQLQVTTPAHYAAFHELERDFRRDTFDDPYWLNQDILDMSNQIVGDATDDYEKYLLIHNWVKTNIEYDIDSQYQGATRVLENRVAVCEGYANLEVAMLHAQGIAAIHTGNHDPMNHAWTLAYIHNQWYVSDATWDSDTGGGADSSTYTMVHPSKINRPMDEYTLGMTHDIRPSAWAKEEAEAAIMAGIVPMYCRNNLHEPMRRDDFCRLIVRMVRQATGETVYDFTSSPQALALQTKFTDTKCSDVLCAYDMGIVTGNSDTTFNPNGPITRQEAAAMLQRAAKYLGVPSGGAPVAFTDAAAIPGWAKAGVDFCSSLVTPGGKNVLGGTGGGGFSPADPYTTEQAILSVYRLYQIAAQ